MHRIFTTSLASVYPHYLAKVQRKGRTREELDATICWLTGYDAAQLSEHLDTGTTFADFFAGATLNPRHLTVPARQDAQSPSMPTPVALPRAAFLRKVGLG